MKKAIKFTWRVVCNAFLILCLFGGCTIETRAQVAPFVPDFAFGNQVGSIAIRGLQRWQVLAPAATPGKYLMSGGAGALPQWGTAGAGTGNVATDGNSAANGLPYFTNGTTLAYDAPGGTHLDRTLGYTSSTATGVLRRTAQNTYSPSPIGASDMPQFTGPCGTAAAGSATFNCNTLLNTANSWGATQTFPYVVTTGASAGYQFSDRSAPSNYTIVYRSGAQTCFYSSVKTGNVWCVDDNGNILTSGALTASALYPTAPLAVTNGGTGTGTAGGAALDNISAFSSTGLLSRTGAGAYSFSTLTALLDAQIGSTRGAILERGASGWTLIPPGTAGYYLTANGAGADPAYTAPSALPTGTRYLLNTITVSAGAASASDTTSITTSFKEYEIDVEGVVPTATGQCQLTIYYGGTVATTGYQNSGTASTNYNGGTLVAVGPQAAFIPCSLGGQDGVTSGSTSSGVTAQIYIRNPANTGRRNGIRLSFGQEDAVVNSATGDVSGFNASTAAITGFSLAMGGTTLAAGSIKVYGSN